MSRLAIIRRSRNPPRLRHGIQGWLVFGRGIQSLPGAIHQRPFTRSQRSSRINTELPGLRGRLLSPTNRTCTCAMNRLREIRVIVEEIVGSLEVIPKDAVVEGL